MVLKYACTEEDKWEGGEGSYNVQKETRHVTTNRIGRGPALHVYSCQRRYIAVRKGAEAGTVLASRFKILSNSVGF